MPATSGRRRDNFIVAVNCGEAGGTCFCVSMNTGPKVAGRFRSCSDRTARRRPARVSGRGRQRGRARAMLATLPHQPASPEDVRSGGRGGGAHRQPAWAAQLDTDGAQGAAAEPIPTHPRWDDVARALPRLRQLHDGLPDLLLHHGRGPQRPCRPDGGARAPLGFLLHAGFFLHPRRQRAAGDAVALPPMDDAQAGELDRPVRHLGLRRLRPLHHLVPGRHRHHRRGGRDPGNSRAVAKETDHGGT